MPHTTHKNEGFIALITALILSVILITVAASLSQSGFFLRSGIADAEYKERSSATAEACVNVVFLRLAANPFSYPYAMNESLNVGSDQCVIRQVLLDTPLIGQTTIETRAVFQEAATNLRIVVNKADVSLVSWDEIPHF